MGEVWDLVVAGDVTALCQELSLHCHCLNDDFKAPASVLVPDSAVQVSGWARLGQRVGPALSVCHTRAGSYK